MIASRTFSIVGLACLLIAGAAPIVLGQDVTLTSVRSFTSLDGAIEDADGAADGCLTVLGDLHIGAAGLPGAIVFDDPASPPQSSAGAICIHVGGSLEIFDGSRISAQNFAGGGSGGNVTITCGGGLVLRGPGASPAGGQIITNRGGGTSSGAAGNVSIDAGGSVSIEALAAIHADANAGASAGSIVIHAGGAITILGLVSSESQMTGTGAVQKPGGGPITLIAGTGVSVPQGGAVRSKGIDPGADLVHLEACNVMIEGTVESSGHGHAIPDSPPNHLGPPNRPDKPAASTAGVEIWADTIVIDHATGLGTINADTGQAGGTAGRAWIDVIARSSLVVAGDPAPGATGFAIHANQFVTNSHGGTIKLLCKNGPITLSGAAIQADALPGGSSGGSVSIEAGGPALLSLASIFARGDFNQTGGYGTGGHVAVRSFTSSVTWDDGTGDVRPTGTDDVSPVLPAAQAGTILITRATTSSVLGSAFPVNGVPATAPTFAVDGSSTQPGCQSYVVIPSCLCASPAPATVTDLGPGCGNPAAPIMTITPPVIGQTLTLTVTSVFPSTMVMIFLSDCGSSPFVVAGSCPVYVDLASLEMPLLEMTDTAGNWTFTYAVPPDPALVGRCFVIQGVVWSNTGPLEGDNLTNGLRVTIGCE